MRSCTYIGRLPPRWYEPELKPDARKGIILSQPTSVLWVKYWRCVTAQSASVGVRGQRLPRLPPNPVCPLLLLCPWHSSHKYLLSNYIIHIFSSSQMMNIGQDASLLLLLPQCILKHDCRWKGDVLILAMPAHNISGKSKGKSTNAAKALQSSRQTEKLANNENPGWAMHCTSAAQLKHKKEKEQNKINPKPKMKQKEGSWGTLGNAELWEKCSFRENKMGESISHKKGSFQPGTDPLSCISCSVKAEG